MYRGYVGSLGFRDSALEFPKIRATLKGVHRGSISVFGVQAFPK